MGIGTRSQLQKREERCKTTATQTMARHSMFGIGMHSSPLLLRFWFADFLSSLDYLRQSIMCHSDTNIEPYVEGKGYKGWGEHRCRKYEDVAVWVKETQGRYGGYDEYPDLAGS